jgi:hypothetical protein
VVGSGIVGYKLQVAVDAKHHLVVTSEVTNSGSDRSQLFSTGQQIQGAIGIEKLTALADRGYYKGDDDQGALHDQELSAHCALAQCLLYRHRAPRSTRAAKPDARSSSAEA